MRTEETIVNIIFDAGRGSVAQESREGTCGHPFGQLPTPARSGYRFDGWYCGEELVTADTIIESETDVRLVAHWSRAKATGRLSSFKRQRLAVIILAACAVLLAVAWTIVSELISIYTLEDSYVKDGVEYTDEYLIKRDEDGAYKLFDKDGNKMPSNGISDQVFIAYHGIGNQYRIDPDTAEYKLVATVDPEEWEGVQGTTLLIFPQITSSYMYSLHVTHADGTSYRFVRGENGLQLEGYEDVAITFDDQLFAKLCLAAGWTACTRKLTAESDVALLEDGSIDYAVYGLDTPNTIYTVSNVLFKKDANGNMLYENDSPVADYAESTDQNGETVKKLQADPDRTYSIKIGDLTPSKTGYYVQLEGEKAIYVLSATYIGETLVKPIEELVTPMAFHQVSVNVHSMVEDFFLARLDEWSEEGIQNGKPIVSFTYLSLEERRNTMDQTTPYASGMGFQIDDTVAADALESLYSIEYVRCVKLGEITNSLLAEYGLDKDVYYLKYVVPVSYNDGKNEVLISREKNENGNYYVASFPYHMIVEVSPSHLSFLEKDDSEWYHESFLSQNIAYLDKLEYTHNGNTYKFDFDNSLSYCYYIYKTQDADGNISTVFSSVDSSAGYLEKQGDQIIYRSYSGASYETIFLDLDNVTVLSYRDAVLNPNQSNVIYTEVSYYYTDSTGSSVYVSPDFKTKDIIYEDGAYYYVDSANGMKVRVNRKFGESPIYRYKPGYEATVMISSGFMSVTLNDQLLDYTIVTSEKDDTGVIQTETISALENFRNLFIQWISFSLEGVVDEKEFQKWSGGKSIEAFLAEKPTADAELIIEAEDHASVLNGYTEFDKETGEESFLLKENTQRNILVRFYKYSDWKALVTIQPYELDENGNRVYSDEKATGQFFVNANYLQILENNIEKLSNQEVIPAKGK